MAFRGFSPCFAVGKAFPFSSPIYPFGLLGVVWFILQCSVSPTRFSNVRVLQLKMNHPCSPGQSKKKQLLGWWCLDIITNFIFFNCKAGTHRSLLTHWCHLCTRVLGCPLQPSPPFRFAPVPPGINQMCPIHAKTQQDLSPAHPSGFVSHLCPQSPYYEQNCTPAKFLCWNSNPQCLRIWLCLETGSLKR